MRQHRPLLLAGALVVSTACAAAPIETAHLHEPPGMDRRLASIGNIGVRSDFEMRALYAAQDPGPAAPPTTDRGARKKPVTPVLFYLGIVMAAVAGGAALGTAFASYGLRRKLDNGYFTEGFNNDEFDTIVDRGDRLSKATWGLGLTAFAFAAMALISYSVDWSRCGPLAPKRRRDTAPIGRCEEYHPDHKPVILGPAPAPADPPPAATEAAPGPAPEGPAAAPGN